MMECEVTGARTAKRITVHGRIGMWTRNTGAPAKQRPGHNHRGKRRAVSNRRSADLNNDLRCQQALPQPRPSGEIMPSFLSVCEPPWVPVSVFQLAVQPRFHGESPLTCPPAQPSGA